MTILDPTTGERVVIDLAAEREKRKDRKPSDTWLKAHQAETQAFIEERRAFALGDPGDETE